MSRHINKPTKCPADLAPELWPLLRLIESRDGIGRAEVARALAKDDGQTRRSMARLTFLRLIEGHKRPGTHRSLYALTAKGVQWCTPQRAKTMPRTIPFSGRYDCPAWPIGRPGQNAFLYINSVGLAT